MSTSANIVIKRPDGDLAFYVTHDGYPTFMLHVLAGFLGLPSAEQDMSTFERVYRGPTSPDACSSSSVSQGASVWANWSYVLDTDGTLSVLWDKAPRGQRCCDPYDYLEVIMDEYREAERAAIRQGVSRLAALGITIKRPVVISDVPKSAIGLVEFCP